MSQRISYGLLAILTVLAIVALDVRIAESCSWDGPLGDLLRRGSLIPICYTLVVLLGAREMVLLYRRMDVRPHITFACVMVTVMMLSPWLSAAGLMGSQARYLEGIYWQVLWLGAAVVGTAIMEVIRGNPTGTIRNVGATWIMVLYLGFLNSFAVQLRCAQHVPGVEGAWLLLVVLLVAKGSDIGAYLIGTTFGRHRLAPNISAGKSIEGTIGGLLASTFVAILLAALPHWVGMPAPPTEGQAPTLGENLAGIVAMITGTFGGLMDLGAVPRFLPAILFGLALSLSGQFGDLFESSFKREAGLKDSGQLIPRFGGILDLIDSPALAVPVAWLLLTEVWSIV